jgi:hypothetical protein
MKLLRLRQHPIFWSIICLNLAILLLRFFELVLVDRLTIFVLPLLWLLGLLAVLVGLIVAIAFWIYSAKKGLWRGKSSWRRMVPLGIQLVAIGLIIFVPFDDLWLAVNFQQQLSARQQVIRLMESNQIPSSADFVTLPAAYQSTTVSDSEVQVFYENGDRYVLFFTFRSIDNAAGFVHSESGRPFVLHDSVYRIKEQLQIQPQWFYVSLGE